MGQKPHPPNTAIKDKKQKYNHGNHGNHVDPNDNYYPKTPTDANMAKNDYDLYNDYIDDDDYDLSKRRTHPTATSVDKDGVSRLDFRHKMEKLVSRQPNLQCHNEDNYRA